MRGVPLLEHIESRRLLTASFAHGVATILGTTGNDDIQVVLTPAGVEAHVNGMVEGLWALRKITRLEIAGFAGKDFIWVHATSTTRRGVVTPGIDLVTAW